MKGSFTAPAGTLAAAVKYAARWIATKPVNPIHGGLMFEIPAFGDRLSIFGFNENATGRASIDVEGDATGAFVVSGRLLDQLVATFGDKPVTFEQHDSTIAVSTGRWRGTLPAMSEKDYPALPGQAPLAGYVDGAALADAVRRVGAAASRDLTKQISLCGVHVSFDEDTDFIDGEEGGYTLTLMATDTYHGARQSLLWTPDAERAPLGETTLILASLLVDGVESFVGRHPVELGWQEGVFSLTTPDRSLVVSTLSSEGRDGFPAAGLQPIFDRETTAAFTLRIKDLALPLKRASLLRSREVDVVTLGLSENLMNIGVAGDMNTGDEEIDVEYDGPETSLMLKSEVMQAALHTAPGDVVTMAFTPGTTKPIVVTSPENPAWRHILVPLRKMG